ncbi:hypothetical protein DIZ76_016474 [Coccidioides immitis]|uniref:Mediator of RNA polymerase II transcription subunit 1 n=2 Tax=Coccidioides TaxID=5500 RepID=A0A0J6YNF4_COCIT|nr:hypothetical protein CPAG_08025 [Coccidioides posadasii RMSCC 3488]KMP08699.1 hypothetical protein CIRG_08380 [Coccidioides immitis RMSCC 2394]TPX20582.1 hypothetical protein DIZ76_016474 [Coccidioides immitis]
MATPFSKSNLGATPTQFTSSPHPSAVPMGRPLSHKSPSMKTPSASGQGHQNYPSTSSHQYPTPLPITSAAIEDVAVFSSPSALLALGLGGITPSPAANDALGGQGINEGDLHSMAIPSLGITGPKDIEDEKRKRIDEVLQLLRTRVAGRGVCREGIERLGKLEGLECMWQDNDLSIAGNSLDLEVEFEPGQEIVKNVTLRYATPDAPEGERRVEASEVLKRNLMQGPGEQEGGHWKSMAEFHENLRRLARLDQLSREINCFEAVEGIYECLRRIWDEEKKHGTRQSHLDHICKGWIGKPSMHGGKHVGLMLRYWVDQRRMFEAKQVPPSNAMDTDLPAQDDEEVPDKANFYSAAIECETGYPSLRVSKEWVSADVFTEIRNEDGGDNELEIRMINWTEPPPTLVSPLSNNPDSVALEPTILSSTAPNIRFVARLEPPVDMPIFAAVEIYRAIGANMMQESKTTTYDSLVVPSQGDSNFIEFEGRQVMQKREISTFGADGKPVKQRHTYTFNTFEQVPGRTIRDIPFSHPRQLADVLPILRQYAFISSLLRRIFSDSQTASRSDTQRTPGEKSVPQLFQESRPNGYFISNVNPTECRLNSLLRSGRNNGFKPPPTAISTPPANEVRVDISLRTPMSLPPTVLLVFNINEDNQMRSSDSAPLLTRIASRQVMIGADIGLNGEINISHISGILPSNATDYTSNEKCEDEKRKLRSQIARVLETCEDLGMLVEWVLKWIRKHTDG